ncbi:hypothetical protein ON010_g11649 [Phytophthora cinnamomi]|nr:hypothetical protein ON010_g11649 [Phytophthora cinnamomi]
MDLRVLAPTSPSSLRDLKHENKKQKTRVPKGIQSAVPTTPTHSGGTRGDDSAAALITSQLDPIAERTVSFDESMTGSDAKDEDMNEGFDDYQEKKALAPAGVTLEIQEGVVMSAGRSGNVRCREVL